mgnify:CR=1 FL=1
MMKSIFKALCGAVALTALLTAGSAVAQQPLTARSVVAALDAQKLTYEVPNFRIGGKYDLAQPASWADGGVGGTTLESLGAKPARTAYIAMGTPQRNAKGEIINAIVVNSYYSGDATTMVSNWVAGQAGNAFSGGALVGPGLLFDTNRFYVVFLDALGLGCPGLGACGRGGQQGGKDPRHRGQRGRRGHAEQQGQETGSGQHSHFLSLESAASKPASSSRVSPQSGIQGAATACSSAGTDPHRDRNPASICTASGRARTRLPTR